MLPKKMILAAVLMLVISATAAADWNPNMPYKWAQLPDLNPTGMDVLASSPKVLADDFLCDVTGRITDIHIWGSWLNDLLPSDAAGAPDPSAIGFRLSIHADIPKGGDILYSHPGELLWETVIEPGSYQVLSVNTGEEGWFNPNTGEYLPVGDTIAWQYNFIIDPADSFIQRGTKDIPIVYWLDVEALVEDVPGVANALFGWKTSILHWNDDAVFSDPSVVPPVPWQELRYPDGHPYQGESIDLAFVVNGIPEPATMSLLALGSLFVVIRRRGR